MAKCWNCGRTYEPPDKITRESECPHCAAYLRCCRNCGFYDVHAPNQCREPSADLQPDKEAANACDYFRPGSASGGSAPKKGRGDFDSLFKD
ncbi:MAG: hypothetical protein HY304_02505 [candidate division Zixibacteria bacterium]|nr:hypothetical protein [candidate division Zixibacteria bacterium]